MASQYALAGNAWPDVSLDGEHLDELLAVFHSVCDSLDLDAGDRPLARLIARTIIEAALAGEHDLERLYDRALRAAQTS